MAKLQALRNNIMFKFLDETTGSQGKFTDQKTPSGIVIPTLDSSQKLPRWGQVISAGPLSAAKEGEYILIEALMWTNGVVLDGEKYWKTEDSKVLLATTDINDTKGTTFE